MARDLPCIDVRGLTRTFRVGDVDVQALRGVDLRIERGELVAIMGSSGSGKSTLMALLGCLDRPSSGQYLFEGSDVARLAEPELARIRSGRIGFVFQSFNLLPRTSALENVALPLIYAEPDAAGGAPRAERARRLLERLGLDQRAGNTPAQLSGGQQQRVAIARALVNEPAVLLADEPTGNLDSRNAHEIMDTLVRLNREQGVTVIVVTHEPDIAAYARRVITMRDGQVVSDLAQAPVEAAGEAGVPTSAAPSASASVSPPPPPRRPADGPRATLAFARMVTVAAAQALLRNRTRSALTMLGVFIGVAALIAMVAVGQGANEAVRKQIESLGTNLFVVVPGATIAGGVRSGFGSASTLTVADAAALRREAPAVAQVAYLIRQAGQVQYRDQNWTTGISGVTAGYPPITNWAIAEGRGLTEDDDRTGALVAVIGETVRRQLFAESESPVGATILVRGIPLKVVGLFQPKGQTAFGQDQDDLVMIPFGTAERRVLGVATPSASQSTLAQTYVPLANPFGLQPRMTGYVNQIFVQAASAGQVRAAIAEVTAVLARRHRLRPGETADFSVRNLSQIADAAQGSSQVMAVLLAVVASISLLVGGIGIMNILLVSVTERTREIGLRMAIGAQRRQVLLQFLAEAVFMSVIGGVAGIVVGAVSTRAISLVAHWPTLISPTAVAGGFVFSAAVGVFFGYYPARKAARLDPIEALRYE